MDDSSDITNRPVSPFRASVVAGSNYPDLIDIPGIHYRLPGFRRCRYRRRHRLRHRLLLN